MEAETIIEEPSDEDGSYPTEELARALTALRADDAFWDRLYLLATRALARCKWRYGYIPGIKPTDVVVELIDQVETGRRKCPRSLPLDVFFAKNIRWIASDLCRPRVSETRSQRVRGHERKGEDEGLDVTHQGKSAEDEVASKLLIEALHTALAKNPNAQKVLLAKFVEGRTGKDVEVATGLTGLQVQAAEKAIIRLFRGIQA